jgi:hypothetical protein
MTLSLMRNLTRVASVALLLFVLSGCGNAAVMEERDVCAVDLTWEGRAYDGIDFLQAPELESELPGEARIGCIGGGRNEPTSIAAIQGVSPTIAIAALPPNMSASEYDTIWVLRGSRELHAAVLAFCLREHGVAVESELGDTAGTALFSRERDRKTGRWADWSVTAADPEPRIETDSQRLRRDEGELFGRCLDTAR